MSNGDFTKIAGNISALQALNSLSMINGKLGVAQLRLATGKRINSAADDAAGLGIATKLDFKTRGLGQALANIGDATNLISVSEGHLNNIKDILAVMKTKAEQAANDTLGTDERTAILTELTKMNDQIDAEKSQAKWSDVSLLNNAGSQNTLKFQIGEGVTTADSLSFNVASAVFGGTASAFDSTGLGVTAGAAARNSSSAALSSNYTTNALSTTSALGNATVGELASGHYTVEVSSAKVGAGTGAAATAQVTIKVRDAGGNLMTLDSDGTAGGASGTQMVRTLTAASTAGTINLGNGMQIHLTGIATGGAKAALLSVDYTKKGNAVDSQSNAQAFMTKIDAATTKISTALAYIGSLMNRLDYQASSVTVAKTNTEAAFNRIMNADMAAEQVNATKYSVLAQTATAMLGQANQRPQSILSLFR